MSSLKNRISSLVFKTCRVKSFNPFEAVVIVTDPRSGGTWLAETLAGILRLSIIHEPLNLNIQQVKDVGFNSRQHIPHDETWPEANQLLDKVLAGKLLNNWTSKPSLALRGLFRKGILVKFTRAKALFPWLMTNFQFKSSPIVLLRNPLCVIASQMEHPGWKNINQYYFLQSGKFTEVYSIHKRFIEKLSTPEEIMIAGWCITTKILLQQNYNQESPIIVFYEKLLTDHDQEIRLILQRWDQEAKITRLGPSHRASRSTYDSKIKIVEAQNQLIKYKGFFTRAEKRRLLLVLDHFAIDYPSLSDFPEVYI